MTSQEKRAERMPAHVIDHGPIGGEPPSELWDGTISSKDAETEAVSRAIESIDGYFVEADDASPDRCIDGRPRKDGKKEEDLGAQLPGGTAAIALAAALVEGPGETFVGDFKGMLARYEKLGLTPGDHVDDHAHGENVGCGAIDQLIKAIEKMSEPGFAEAIHPYLQAILGSSYDAGMVGTVLGRFSALHEAREGYFEGDDQDGYAYKQKTIAALKEGDPDSVEELTGNHGEVALVVNHVPGTTLDRDRFSSENGGIQAFNYDFWRVREIAEKLFPKDKRKQQEFLTISAIQAVATMMKLSDGTTRLVSRSR